VLVKVSLITPVPLPAAFGVVVMKFLNTHPVQPLKDPRVQEALHLHQ
jgi:hypothetical protein